MSELTAHDAGLPRPGGGLADARRAIEEALPTDPAQNSVRDRMLAFLDAHPDALHRSCADGHLTGSALVVDPSTRRVLLLFHAKVQRWLQPGGHADGDGCLAHVSLREATEETSIRGLRVVTPAIDLDVHLLHADAGSEPDHLHLDVRHLVLAPAGSTGSSNHESEGLVWAAVDELEAYGVDVGTHRMARAGLAALDRLALS